MDEELLRNKDFKYFNEREKIKSKYLKESLDILNNYWIKKT